MNAELTLTDVEVSVVASALNRQRDHLSKLRAVAERCLAESVDLGGVDWAGVACREECDLAALDGLAAKLPGWVAVYMARVTE